MDAIFISPIVSDDDSLRKYSFGQIFLTLEVAFAQQKAGGEVRRSSGVNTSEDRVLA
jgi:hypothetical protein